MGAPAPNQTMSISTYYDAQRYYAEQERRYREEMERQRMMAMQSVYDINTDTFRGVSAKQMQEGVKPKPAPTPEYLNNKNLLLLGEAS